MQLDLSGLDDTHIEQRSGVPLDLPIDAVDEDPEQPRIEFDEAALAELAETIRDRGVRQPVSVRPHPDRPGRWILNFGARRLRASVLAGRRTVPAFVDVAADGYDQIIENEQRQNLQPLELALFVQRRLRAGETQAEVARRLGKSRAYVTYVAALIDAPDPVLALYRSGRCRGLTELYDVRRLYEAQPHAVAEWFNSAGKVTRTDVERLKNELLSRRAAVPDAVAQSARFDASGPARNSGDMNAVCPPAREQIDELVAVISQPAVGASAGPTEALAGPLRWYLLAQVDGADVVVEMRRLPPGDEQVFVAGLDAKGLVAVDIGRLQALRLVRGVA